MYVFVFFYAGISVDQNLRNVLRGYGTSERFTLTVSQITLVQELMCSYYVHLKQ